MRRYPSLLLFLSLSIAVPGAGAARDLSWMRNQIFFFFFFFPRDLEGFGFDFGCQWQIGK